MEGKIALFHSYPVCSRYSTEHKLIEKITATEPPPHRNVLNYFAIFKNVAQSLEPGETGSKLCTTFLNIEKCGEIKTKYQFTGTGLQPHRNRK